MQMQIVFLAHQKFKTEKKHVSVSLKNLLNDGLVSLCFYFLLFYCKTMIKWSSVIYFDSDRSFLNRRSLCVGHVFIVLVPWLWSTCWFETRHIKIVYQHL